MRGAVSRSEETRRPWRRGSSVREATRNYAKGEAVHLLTSVVDPITWASITRRVATVPHTVHTTPPYTTPRRPKFCVATLPDYFVSNAPCAAKAVILPIFVSKFCVTKQDISTKLPSKIACT